MSSLAIVAIVLMDGGVGAGGIGGGGIDGGGVDGGGVGLAQERGYEPSARQFRAALESRGRGDTSGRGRPRHRLARHGDSSGRRPRCGVNGVERRYKPCTANLSSLDSAHSLRSLWLGLRSALLSRIPRCGGGQRRSRHSRHVFTLTPRPRERVEQEYAKALASVPDGPAKDQGMALGQQAARANLDRRSADRIVPGPWPPRRRTNRRARLRADRQTRRLRLHPAVRRAADRPDRAVPWLGPARHSSSI